MSHYVVVVQLPAMEGDEVDGALGEALAPFDENKRDDPYDVDCECVRSKVREEVHQVVSGKFGDIETLRAAFADLPSTIRGREEQLRLQRAGDAASGEEEKNKLFEEAFVVSRRQDKEWQDFIRLREREEAEEVAEAEARKKVVPDPKCEECHGSGKVKSTYNKNAKWDWYEVGGRWSRFFGKDDVVKGKDARKFFLEDKNRPPFAILSKDGKWHEKGRMGWWAMVSGDKGDDWAAEAESVIGAFGDDDVIVAVDCHI